MIRKMLRAMRWLTTPRWSVIQLVSWLGLYEAVKRLYEAVKRLGWGLP